VITTSFDLNAAQAGIIDDLREERIDLREALDMAHDIQIEAEAVGLSFSIVDFEYTLRAHAGLSQRES
jgi:hypothetical protein